jgi:hypothetical protein
MSSDRAPDHATPRAAGSGGPGLRRRSHAEGPRTHQIVVRLSAREFASIRAVTDGAGMVPGAWLGELGVRVAAGKGNPIPPRWLDLVDILVTCRQDIARVARLLGAGPAAEELTMVRRILARVDEVTDRAATAARSTRPR